MNEMENKTTIKCKESRYRAGALNMTHARLIAQGGGGELETHAFQTVEDPKVSKDVPLWSLAPVHQKSQYQSQRKAQTTKYNQEKIHDCDLKTRSVLVKHSPSRAPPHS